jgi:hypothetical protein
MKKNDLSRWIFALISAFLEAFFVQKSNGGDNALTGKEKYAVIIENGA